MKRATPVTLLLTLTLLSGCTNVTRLDFTSWGRAIWQRPEDVVRALALPSGSTVADIGAGDGYFVPYLLEAVGAGGRVYAVEVDDELVDGLKDRFATDARVEVVRGHFDDPLLPDGQVDLVLIVNTYHHIENREPYFRSLATDLSPNGRVAVLEPNAELTGILGFFLEEGHESLAANVEREMRAAGYQRVESLHILPIQIFEIFGIAP